MSLKFRNNSLLNLAWTLWLKRCDQREEIINYNQIREAQHHYRERLLRKSLLKLTAYVNHQRHKRSLYATADLQFESKIIPKIFNNLRSYTNFRRYKRELLEDAIQFRTENLFSMVFYHWRNRLEKNREHRLNKRIALLHREKLLVRKTFSYWRIKTAETIMIQTQMVLHHKFILIVNFQTNFSLKF